VYMPIWNDSDLVRVVLKHYETADRIIFYDAGCTDDSIDIIKSAGREIRQLETNRLCDKTNIKMKNEAWKESRGHADYVIIADTDELIFFPKYPNDIISALTEWKENKITHSSVISIAIIIKDDEFKNCLARLSTHQQPNLSALKGLREDPIHKLINKDPYMYDKPMIFNPNAIVETNFQVGQHYWNPQFNQPSLECIDKPVMLHWRYIGQTREFNRTQTTRERIKHQFNLGYGIQYDLTDKQIEDRTKWIYDQGVHINLFPIFKRVIPFIGSKDFLCYTHNDDDYISRQIASGKTWEPSVAAAIAKLCDNKTLFIDIGANIGLHSFTAAMCGARVLAFEAHPLTCKLLKTSINANGWQNRITVREVACSNTDGDVINLIDDPHNMGGSSLEIRASGTKYSVITSQIDSESICPYSTNIVIKMDVEGHEEFVIKGMTKTLDDNRVSSIIVELNPMIKSEQSLIQNVYDPLINLGFSDVRILLKHPPNNWEGDPIQPGLPDPILQTEQYVSELLSKGVIVELLFIRS